MDLYACTEVICTSETGTVRLCKGRHVSDVSEGIMVRDPAQISLFLVIHCLRFLRSIVNHLSVPCGMRISAEKRFLTMRVNFLQFIPRNFLKFP